MLLSMEDVVTCLGFSSSDSPLARVANFPEIVDAMAHMAATKNPDSISPEQREAADTLMCIMRTVDTAAPLSAQSGQDAPIGRLAAAEAAAQVLAMVAADDTKNPHLLHLDKWIVTCCTVLKRCRPGADPTQWSEPMIVCAASCLADLSNNPRSTVLCSTRAVEIFVSLQYVLLLPNVDNRMVYFQACRGLSEILHPSTWPMYETAKVPKKLLGALVSLLQVASEKGSHEEEGAGNDEDASLAVVTPPREVERPEAAVTVDSSVATDSPVAEQNGEVEGSSSAPAAPASVSVGELDGAPAVSLGQEVTASAEESEAAASAEVARARQGASESKTDPDETAEEGVGEEGEQGVEKSVSQEELIGAQAARVVQFMATSGAAALFMEHAPGIIAALQGLRSGSAVVEVVLHADSALMSLWLSSEAYSATLPQLRPIIAENLLRALGSEELVENHQDCSLALVTATMNPSKAVREEALKMFGSILHRNGDLVRILIGHIEDCESLAHQSVVYFVLHLLEDDTALEALSGTPACAGLLVPALVMTASTERHYAPITALTCLVYNPVSRPAVRPLIGKQELQKLRSIPGGRVQRELEALMNALVATDKDPNHVKQASDHVAYREDPSLQSLFFRQLVLSKASKSSLALFKRTKSADDVDMSAIGDDDAGDSDKASDKASVDSFMI